MMKVCGFAGVSHSFALGFPDTLAYTVEGNTGARAHHRMSATPPPGLQAVMAVPKQGQFRSSAFGLGEKFTQ